MEETWKVCKQYFYWSNYYLLANVNKKQCRIILIIVHHGEGILKILSSSFIQKKDFYDGGIFNDATKSNNVEFPFVEGMAHLTFMMSDYNSSTVYQSHRKQVTNLLTF
jgi:hypothetical protein